MHVKALMRWAHDAAALNL